MTQWWSNDESRQIHNQPRHYPYSFFNTHLGIKKNCASSRDFLRFLIPKWVLKSMIGSRWTAKPVYHIYSNEDKSSIKRPLFKQSSHQRWPSESKYWRRSSYVLWRVNGASSSSKTPILWYFPSAPSEARIMSLEALDIQALHVSILVWTKWQNLFVTKNSARACVK